MCSTVRFAVNDQSEFIESERVRERESKRSYPRTRVRWKRSPSLILLLRQRSPPSRLAKRPRRFFSDDAAAAVSFGSPNRRLAV